MRRLTLSALAITLLLLMGCAPAPDEAPPVPKPTQTQIPKPSVEPEPDPYEGWVEAEFAFGFASVKTPEDATVVISDNERTGTTPRWGGGYADITLSSGEKITLRIYSAAGYVASQAGPPCGDTAIATFPGSEHLGTDNEVWLTAGGEGANLSLILSLANGAPLGDRCAAQAALPGPEGGGIVSFLHDHANGSEAERDPNAWAVSEAGLEAIKVLQSLTVR